MRDIILLILIKNKFNNVNEALQCIAGKRGPLEQFRRTAFPTLLGCIEGTDFSMSDFLLPFNSI